MSAALPIRRVEKVWGCDVLPAPFTAAEGERIGEIWFEPPPGLEALLVKYIFTSEKLSVQVHPPGDSGKEECWLVVDAAPGAVLGIGFNEPLDAAQMRAAALDGSIERKLTWYPVRAGDFVYIPAGTVHAIGAGISLIEVQQNNDVTYRFYDYGRPRELHLDEAAAVAIGQPLDPALRRHIAAGGHLRLVDGPYFRLDRADGPPDADIAAHYAGPLLAIPLDGAITVDGESIDAGGCAVADTLDAIVIPSGVQCLLAQPCTGEP